MKRTSWPNHLPRWLPAFITLIILLAGPSAAIAADPVNPRVAPPLILPNTSAPDVDAPGMRAAGPAGLIAVLIVGPIDGDYGPATTTGKEVMDMAAAELAANGVTVRKFYTPANDWAQITAAAKGAHFLFYRGHGVYWSNLPHPTVGGFYLKDQFILPNDIRSDLRLARGAIIVMSSACFASGSSSVAGDIIDSSEALRRVAQYSDPFFDIDAGGYYSNWYHQAPQMFVRYLFAGMTLGQTYEAFFDYNPHTTTRYRHPEHPALDLWLDQDTYGGVVNYNYAFAGQPESTLVSLFGAGNPLPRRAFLPLLRAP
jgi:hypothetical protein